MRSSCHPIIALLGTFLTGGLFGCTESMSTFGDHASLLSAASHPPVHELPDYGLPDYGLRLKGDPNSGSTSVFLFTHGPDGERETFVDRCAEVDTDEFLPEGLLIPILCDGRRIVVEEEGGRFIVRGGRSPVAVDIEPLANEPRAAAPPIRAAGGPGIPL